MTEARQQDGLALREALERVEWIQQKYNGRAECMWCHHYRDEGHAQDCVRQTTLASLQEPDA